MPSPQLKHPYTVVTVSSGRCKQEQVVQILARTGFWSGVRQSTNAEAGHDKITPPTTMGGTMILPDETAADSAGMQSYRRKAWWARRDDHCVCANFLPAVLPTRIGSVDRMP